MNEPDSIEGLKPCPFCTGEPVDFADDADYEIEAFDYDKSFVVFLLTVFGLAALVIFGCFAVDAVTHLAVPQVAMINDMLEMVQQ